MKEQYMVSTITKTELNAESIQNSSRGTFRRDESALRAYAGEGQ